MRDPAVVRGDPHVPYDASSPLLVDARQFVAVVFHSPPMRQRARPAPTEMVYELTPRPDRWELRDEDNVPDSVLQDEDVRELVDVLAHRVAMLIDGKCYASGTYDELNASEDEKIRQFFH